jgi:hypothetical protein
MNGLFKVSDKVSDKTNYNSILFIHYIYCCTQNSFVNVFQFGLDRLWVSSGDFIHDIFQNKLSISVFDEVNAIESTGVAVLLKDDQIRGCPVDEPPAKRCKRGDDGVEGTYDYELECYLKGLSATVCCADQLPSRVENRVQSFVIIYIGVHKIHS